MDNYESHALLEFQAAGWIDGDGVFKDEMQENICDHVLKLLKVFASEEHSGTSAPYAIGLFERLASFKPISPLTGEDWEWNEVDEGHFQNKRDSSVFKTDEGAYDIDGKVFWEWFYDKEDDKMIRGYFTSADSSVPVTFPYTHPKTPEYIFRPTEEFPNEELN